MSEINTTEQQTSDDTFTFTASAGLYQLKHGVNKTDIHDQLAARLAQLSAMLDCTYGCGAETFQNWSFHIKDNYMWACASIAKECRELASHI